MILRFGFLALLALGVAAQGPPAPNITAVSWGDQSVSVSWVPNDNGAALSYVVTASVIVPYPLSPAPVPTVVDAQTFSGSLNAAAWGQIITGTCAAVPGSSSYGCYSTSSAVGVSGSSLAISSPGYSQFTQTDTLLGPSAASYRTDWAWSGAPVAGYTGPAVAPGQANPFQGGPGATFQARLSGLSSTSGSYTYAMGGLVVYDMAVNNNTVAGTAAGVQPRWLLRYTYQLTTPSGAATLAVVFPNSIAYNSFSQTTYVAANAITLAVASITLPCDLFLIRNPSPDPVNAPYGGSWGFAYQGANMGAAVTSATVVLDTDIFSFAGWGNPAVAPTNYRVGLHGASTYSYSTTASFSQFNVLTTSSLVAVNAYAAFWSARNSSIAALGACSVSHDVSKTVPASVSVAALRGLANGVAYNVRITAVGAGGATSPVPYVWTGGPVTPTVALPVPGASLFLDANSLTPQLSGGAYVPTPVSNWFDASGKLSNGGFGFAQSTTAKQPLLQPRSSTVPYQSVRFTSTAGQVLAWNGDQSQYYLAPDLSNHNMTIFLLYQPRAPTVTYTYSMAFSNGLYSTTDSGYHYYAYSGYYIFNTPNSYYPFSYGFRVGTASTNAASVGGQFGLANPSGVFSPHPHGAAPTLLTFAYRSMGISNTSGSYFIVDACTGQNRGLASDACTSPAPGVAPTASGWSTTVYEYGTQYVPTNVVKYPAAGFSPAMRQALTVGGYAYGTGTTTDYYNGDVHAMALYKGPLAQPDMLAVQNFLLGRYAQACPAPPQLPGMLPPTCAGTFVPTGSSCGLSCDAGGATTPGSVPYVGVGGTSSVRCSGGAWAGKGIVCAPVCPTLNTDPAAAVCSKTFANETFDGGATGAALPFSSLPKWDITPAIPASLADSYWSVQGGWLVSANPTPSDDSCIAADPSGLFLSSPAWVANMALTDPLKLSADVRLPGGARGGLLFRVTPGATGGPASYYRLTVLGGGCAPLLEYVAAGVLTARPAWPPSAANTGCVAAGGTARLSVSIVAQSPTVLTATIVAAVNGVTLWTVTDASLPSGSIGVWAAAGGVSFDNVLVGGNCDSGGAACRGMSAGQSCNYTCGPGFYGSGSALQTCGGSGAYLGAPFACVPYPPVFRGGASSSLNVSDAAPAGTVLGVLNATASVSSQVVLFTLAAAGNTEAVRDGFGNVVANASDVFAVNLCSGVLRLNNGAVLNGNFGSTRFYLTVTACTNGNPLACTNASIVVNVLAAPKPPAWALEGGNGGAYARTVPENSPAGTRINPPLFANNVNGDANVYTIVFGNAAGIFALNNATGQLSVARSGTLDFEVTPSYNLVVAAADAKNANLTSSVVVTITLLDVNDPPVQPSPAPQVMTVPEASAVAGAALGVVIVTDEDAVDTPLPASAYVLLTSTVRLNGAASPGLLALDAPPGGYPANPGLLRLASPLGLNFSTLPIVSAAGRLVRGGAIGATLNVTDHAGANVLASVIVYVIANVPAPVNSPIVSGVAFPYGETALAVDGSTTIAVMGQYFSAISGAPFAVWSAPATGGPNGLPARNYSCTCGVVADSQIRCPPAPLGPGGCSPGFGAGLTLSVFASANGVYGPLASGAVLSLAYAPPTVIGVSPGTGNPAALPTAGGVTFTITGSNLWAPGVPLSVLSISLGGPGGGGSFTATPINATGALSPSSITVLAGPGFNANANGSAVTVTLGGLSSASAAAAGSPPPVAVSWANPTITNVSMNTGGGGGGGGGGTPLSSSALSANGGNQIVLTGTNFGPASASASTIVRYGSYSPVALSSGNVSTPFVLMFRASACVHDAVSPHTRMTCTSAPGVGTGHTVFLTVGASPEVTSPRALPLSYAPPVVSGISGVGLSDGSTTGSAVVVFSGSNLGPVASPIGDPTVATLTAPVYTVTYGSLAGSYLMTGCHMQAGGGGGGGGTLVCATAPGVGKGLNVTVVASGQTAPAVPGTIAYAPPMVLAYVRVPDNGSANGSTSALPLDGFSTPGGQLVRVLGSNFGPFINPRSFTASYSTKLTQPMNQYGLSLGGAGGALTFTVPPVSCIMEVPHTSILCPTVEGAGHDLVWDISIGGQDSTTPTTSYGAPAVYGISLLSGVTGAPIPAAGTEGNDTAVLSGVNFGPATACAPRADGVVRCYGLVQAIAYGPTGTEYSPLDFSVTSDASLSVVLRPGFGSTHYFTLRVADQASGAIARGSTPSFGFAAPVVFSVTPSAGLPTAGMSVITVTGANWGLLDPRSSVGVAVGNPSDGSFSVFAIPLTPLSVTPSAANEAAWAALDPSLRLSSLTFALPAGLLPLRAVRIAVSALGGGGGGRTYSNYTLDLSNAVSAGADASSVSVSFSPPALRAVTLQSVDSFTKLFNPSLITGNASSIAAGLRAAFPDPAVAAVASVLTLTGDNFGPPRTGGPGGDSIARIVEADVWGNGTFSSANISVWAWGQSRVVLFTTATSGTVRLRQAGKAFDGSALSVASNAISYSDQSPTVNAIAGAITGLSTSGGDILSFTAGYLGSVSEGLLALVGPSPCVFLDHNNAPIPYSGTLAMITADGSYHSAGYTDTAPEWALRCIVPPGEGANVPLTLLRDSDPSTDTLTVSYAPPRVSGWAVWNPLTGGWAQSTLFTPGVAGFAIGGPNTLVVSTAGTRVRIDGTNFGPCPLITAAGGVSGILALASPSACGNRSGVSYYAGTDLVVSATSLVFTTDEGEGLGGPLLVGQINQDTTTPAGGAAPSSGNGTSGGGSSAGTTPLFVTYANSTVTAVSAGGPTTGGAVITITGTGFGPAAAPPPLVTLGGAPCSPVVRSSHTSLNCTTPPGVGAHNVISVNVGGVTTSNTAVYAYSPPRVDGVAIDGVPVNATAPGGTTGGGNFTLGGPAAGGFNVTLTGANFGAYANSSTCMFVAWRGRDPASSSSFACDGRGSFLGEGEVPGQPWAILDWSHTSITFVFPPGVGARDILPWAGDQSTSPGSNAITWVYDAPVIFGSHPVPPTGPTLGGEPITLLGRNFGLPGLYSPAPGVTAAAVTAPLPSDLGSYLSALPLATSLTVLNFFVSCYSGYYDAAGHRPALIAGCSPSSIISQADGALVFASAPGIGVDRGVWVTVYDRLPGDAPGVFSLSLPSNIVRFSYDPPLVSETQPTPVLMDGSPDGYGITLFGSNFGSLPPPGAVQWTPDEAAVDIMVAGVPCANAARGYAGSPPIDVLQCTLADTTVGFKNMTYDVAGQVGTTFATATAAVFTACASGYFGHENETCLPCPWADAIPPGALCAGFNASLITDAASRAQGGTHTYPRPLPGYFNLNSSNAFPQSPADGTKIVSGMASACPDGSGTPGRDVCIVPCDPPASCAGDNYCGLGYASAAPLFRCASCAQGYYMNTNKCVKCPDSPYGVVIGFVFIVVLLATGAYILNKKKVNIAFVSIAVDFFQVLAIFAASKVQWPAPVLALFNILSAFNLNIEIVAPECLMPNVSYQQKWSFIMALPVSVAAFFCVVSLCSLAWKKLVKGRKVKLADEGSAFLSSLLLILYVLYIYLTRTVLEIFNCAPTNPPDPGGQLYLSAVFQPCGVPGGVQMTLLPWAVIGLCVYTIGYPALAGALLWSNRELIMEDQLLRAKGTGGDRLTNPHAYATRKRFSRLYYQFKPDSYLWLLAIILRKFCIAATYILFNKNPAFQLAAALLVLFLAYAAQVKNEPYMGPGTFEAVLAAHTAAAYTSPVHARLRATIAGIEGRGRKRARRNVMTRDGRVDARALLGVLLSTLFDYNTVESNMLFSASIVCLMGIMYAAQTSASSFYAASRDAITGVLLVVVAVSITYLVGVIVTEIYVIFTESSRRAALAKKAAAARAKAGVPGSPGDRASLRRSPKLDPANASFDTGDLSNTSNPIFLTRAAGGEVRGSVTNVDAASEAIRAMGGPPSTIELWRIYKETFEQLRARAQDLRDQAGAVPADVKAFMAAEASRAASGRKLVVPKGAPSTGSVNTVSARSLNSVVSASSPALGGGNGAPSRPLLSGGSGGDIQVGAAEAAALMRTQAQYSKLAAATFAAAASNPSGSASPFSSSGASSASPLAAANSSRFAVGSDSERMKGVMAAYKR